jgi:hypothetical protein
MGKLHPSPCAFFIPDGIRRLNNIIARDDFIFVVNGHEYFVSVVEAILLSPTVSSEFTLDVTTRRFEICDCKVEARYFEDIVGLVRGESVKLDHSSRKSMILLCRHLGNTGLEAMFFNLRFDSLSTEILLNPSDSRNLKGLDFCCDLCSCSIEDLSLLDISTLNMIFSNDSLRIESEDWLLNIVIGLGGEYSSLLKHIRLEFVSAEGLSHFLILLIIVILRKIFGMELFVGFEGLKIVS